MAVGVARAEPRPGSLHDAPRQLTEERPGDTEEAGDGVGGRVRIEADIFERRADEEPAVGALDEIVEAAVDDPCDQRLRKAEEDDLPPDRPGVEREAEGPGQAAGPTASRKHPGAGADLAGRGHRPLHPRAPDDKPADVGLLDDHSPIPTRPLEGVEMA